MRTVLVDTWKTCRLQRDIMPLGILSAGNKPVDKKDESVVTTSLDFSSCFLPRELKLVCNKEKILLQIELAEEKEENGRNTNFSETDPTGMYAVCHV